MCDEQARFEAAAHEISRMPGVIAGLQADHVPGPDRRCRGCPSARGASPLWPCRLRILADRAAELRPAPAAGESERRDGEHTPPAHPRRDGERTPPARPHRQDRRTDPPAHPPGEGEHAPRPRLGTGHPRREGTPVTRPQAGGAHAAPRPGAEHGRAVPPRRPRVTVPAPRDGHRRDGRPRP
ncbi:MAG TPA: hypothetical protein VD813_07295 [Pseudonocardia sp.]|nr:hypothetical protein [Pseudonocardia sp.]